ncbi:MAG: hypothetical protein ACXV7J_15405 [Methylomonas sp.]
MSSHFQSAQIYELQTTSWNADSQPLRAELIAIQDDGLLLVQTREGQGFRCAYLETANTPAMQLEIGDKLLVMPPSEDQLGIVLGRIGTYKKPQPQERVIIEASESLTLKCGEASVELRHDGRAMVKGEDVLLRAKGTQRIRAASVAIN